MSVMKKPVQYLLIFLASLVISIVFAPIRGGFVKIGPLEGFHLSSICYLLAYFFFTTFVLRKTKGRLSTWLVVLVILLGATHFELIRRVTHFTQTLISLPEFLIRVSVILSALLVHTIKNRKAAIGVAVFMLLAGLWASYPGYKMWFQWLEHHEGYNKVLNRKRESDKPMTDVMSFRELTRLKKDRLSYSAIFEELEFIPLETTEECLLGDLVDVKYDDGLYFLMDKSHKILVFNEEGKFVVQIGREGHGPGEFTFASKFFVDRKDNMVGVLDYGKRDVHKYNYEGKYIGSIRMTDEFMFCDDIECNSDGTLLVSFRMPFQGTNAGFEFRIVRENQGEYEVVERLLPYKYDGGEEPFKPAYSNLSYYSAHTHFYTSLSDVIYGYSDGVVAPRYKIKGPKPFIEDDFLEKNHLNVFPEIIEKVDRAGYSRGVFRLVEMERYVILGLDNKTLLWDKNTRNGVYLPEIWIDELGIRCLGLLTYASDKGNYGFEFMTPSFLLRNIDFELERPASELFETIRNIKEDDNSIICRYKLKDDLVNTLLGQYGD